MVRGRLRSAPATQQEAESSLLQWTTKDPRTAAAAMEAPRSVRAVLGEAGQLTPDAADMLSALPPGTEVQIEVIEPLERPPGALAHALMLGSVAACAAVVAIFALLGGGWSWTGFRGNGTLWSWLSLLMTPLAAAWLPIRLALGGHRLPSWWRRLWSAVAVVFALTIVLGYTLEWSWTGFGDEALWDWLHLLLFPIVLLALPEWFQRGAPFGPVGLAIAVPTMLAWTLIIVGGYGWGWRWTGFTGNTFRDWLALLIAPFLLPAACRWFHVHWQQRMRWRESLSAQHRS